MDIPNFAKLVERQQIERLHKLDLGCEANILNARTSVKIGKKYTKVDVGTSGKFMIDSEGNIFGIKAYGQINKKHFFGTLETTNLFHWGGYKPVKI